MKSHARAGLFVALCLGIGLSAKLAPRDYALTPAIADDAAEKPRELTPEQSTADFSAHGSSAYSLRPNRTLYTLGRVPGGGRAELTFSVSNSGTKPIIIGRISSSCDCLKVAVPKRTVQPGGVVWGTATLDLNREPAATGALRIEIKALETTGKDAFRFCIDVDVG